MARSGIYLKPAPTIFILSEIKLIDDGLTKYGKLLLRKEMRSFSTRN